MLQNKNEISCLWRFLFMLWVATIPGKLYGEKLLDANRFAELIRLTIKIHDRLAGPMPRIPFGYMQAITGPVGLAPLVIGDLHGDIVSLENNLAEMHQDNEDHPSFFESSDPRSPLYYRLKPGYCLVCTGDYGDRGYHGLEVLQLLMKLKVANPRRCFLLRGNHESEDVDVSGGGCTFSLVDELFVKYPEANQQLLMDSIKALWQCLPSALGIGTKDNQTMKVPYLAAFHGSLEPVLISHMQELFAASAQAATGTIVNKFFTRDDFPVIEESDSCTKKEDHLTVTMNGLLWGDIMQAGAPTGPGRSQCLYSLNMAAYLPRLAGNVGQWEWYVHCAIRGHLHKEGGVFKNTILGFLPLISHYVVPILRNEVLMVNSCPEALSLLTEDAFALLRLDARGWTVTPYIKKIMGTNHCSRVNDMNPALQKIVADNTLYDLMCKKMQDSDVQVSNAATASISHLDEYPAVRTYDLVWHKHPAEQSLWKKIRGDFDQLSGYWRTIINRILDYKLLENKAKDILHDCSTNGFYSVDSAVRVGAGCFAQQLLTDPYDSLERIMIQNRSKYPAFMRAVRDECVVNKSPESTFLLALIDG